MVLVKAINPGLTHIGQLGENEHRTVYFTESADILEMYPNAKVIVLHQRPGDPGAYPVDPSYIQVRDGIVYWTIQSGDVSVEGVGQCNLVFMDGSTIAKLLIYKTLIDPALDGSSTPPEPWESWVRKVTEALNYAPKIINGTWWTWDAAEEAYVDTGVAAKGDPGDPGPTGPPGSEYTVMIQNGQPDQSSNKIWIPLGGDAEFQIPTEAEMRALEARVKALEDRTTGGGN